VDGRIGFARIAVGGGGSTAVRCPEAEAALLGNGLDDVTLVDAAELVPGSLDPITDGRGSSAYKRDMARVCTQRLLQRLVSEAGA
jgi:carbon-monoxide dehydrogenase medium subunit